MLPRPEKTEKLITVTLKELTWEFHGRTRAPWAQSWHREFLVLFLRPKKYETVGSESGLEKKVVFLILRFLQFAIPLRLKGRDAATLRKKVVEIIKHCVAFFECGKI